MRYTYRFALQISAVALAFVGLSTAAYAEYRCATPGLLLLGEKHACELARQPTPRALIQFIHRTQGTYNLYVDDYVNDQDGARWEQAKQRAAPNSTMVAKAKGHIKNASKFD